MTRTENRRSFINSLGTGIVGAALGATLSNGAFAAGTTTRGTVKLAVATICMDGFGDENFKPAFEMLKSLPFKNVEFNCWYARNLTPSGIEYIKAGCSAIGVTPICVQGTSFGASGNIIKDVTHKLWNMEAAKKLGCRRVKFTGSGRGTEGGLDAIIKVLKEITPAAEEMDILVLLENHLNNNLETIQDYEEIFSAIDSPNVGMCMDNAHFDGSNVELLDVVERFHSKILHIDLKDTERKGVHQIVPFGQGVTKNEAVVEKMLSYGYNGYLLVEMVLKTDPSTVQAELARAYNRFKQYEKN